MPTWLVHGFRWPRAAIRIHIILNNLDDCAAEWLMAPATTTQLTSNFRTLHADQMKHLPSLRFIEQYDPLDETAKDQPYAYVCDQVHEVKLGADVDEIRGEGVGSEAWTALAELRDKVAAGEKVGWFIVVNGDVERWAPPLHSPDSQSEQEEDDAASENGIESQFSPTSQRSSVGRPGGGGGDDDDADTKKKGLKKWLGKVRKSKSSKDLNNDLAVRSAPLSPPLPNVPRAVTSPRTANGKAPVPVRAT